jgi:hypothetical protein
MQSWVGPWVYEAKCMSSDELFVSLWLQSSNGEDAFILTENSGERDGLIDREV